jgi:hypothetical protein
MLAWSLKSICFMDEIYFLRSFVVWINIDIDNNLQELFYLKSLPHTKCKIIVCVLKCTSFVELYCWRKSTLFPENLYLYVDLVCFVYQWNKRFLFKVFLSIQGKSYLFDSDTTNTPLPYFRSTAICTRWRRIPVTKLSCVSMIIRRSDGQKVTGKDQKASLCRYNYPTMVSCAIGGTLPVADLEGEPGDPLPPFCPKCAI